MYQPTPETTAVYASLCQRLDGTGGCSLKIKAAHYVAFKFDRLPLPESLNPAMPGYQPVRFARDPGGGRRKGRGFRICTAIRDGRKNEMWRFQAHGTWTMETLAVLHNHLVQEDVPYLYLTNEAGALLSPCFQKVLGPVSVAPAP